ncbi:centromere protein H isoform 2-T2 [Mantella aurantiaca]
MADGDGKNETLDKLRKQSAGLCRVVAVAGDYTASPSVGADTLYRLREQLKQQKFDLQNRISAGELSVDELDYITEENLREAIGQLVLETENVKYSHCNKSLLLQRMQIFYSIQNKLMEKNADSEVLKKTTSHSLDVASLILKEQKKAQAMEKQILEIKEKRMDTLHSYVKAEASSTSLKRRALN